MRVYRTKDGDMVDEIVYRFYGQTSGYVEKVYAANRHLAELGDKLPCDLEIVLPLIAEVESQKEVSLWD
jgi:phage tail protein X